MLIFKLKYKMGRKIKKTAQRWF